MAGWDEIIWCMARPVKANICQRRERILCLIRTDRENTPRSGVLPSHKVRHFVFGSFRTEIDCLMLSSNQARQRRSCLTLFSRSRVEMPEPQLFLFRKKQARA